MPSKTKHNPGKSISFALSAWSSWECVLLEIKQNEPNIIRTAVKPAANVSQTSFAKLRKYVVQEPSLDLVLKNA